MTDRCSMYPLKTRKAVVDVLYFILIAGSVIMALPVAILLLETIAAMSGGEQALAPPSNQTTRARVGVLIPAHDEEVALPAIVPSVRLQLRDGDRLLVVADNCSDDTAVLAERLGAEVAVRTDPTKRGKGFALDYGIRHFADDAPEIVVVIDADCALSDFAIDRLAEICLATNRPVQALYLMLGGPAAPQVTRLREFAWRVRNEIRPRGLRSLGLPCHLMGTGMAFPWELIARANLATDALVEDLKLGLELAAAGHSPMFCPAAVVTSEFPVTDEGSRTQQRRWEQGHLGLIAAEIPGLLLTAIRRRNVDLLVLALDAAVPPLSLLAMMVLSFLLLGAGAWRLGMGSAAFVISLTAFLGLIAATTGCWLKVGRNLLPPSSAFTITGAFLRKITFYWRILMRRDRSGWVRTDRRKK
jgi:cellulose synthase/poly-beta-1,6-N-acetylglucosamine synthase-like glycosyltransferase